MPCKIANYLKLPKATTYTGHSFRRTSATLLADSGANMTTIKRHGGWKSSTVAEGYIADSIENKAKTCELIFNTVNSSDKPKNEIPLKEVEDNTEHIASIESDGKSTANDDLITKNKTYKFEKCEVIINNW